MPTTVEDPRQSADSAQIRVATITLHTEHENGLNKFNDPEGLVFCFTRSRTKNVMPAKAYCNQSNIAISGRKLKLLFGLCLHGGTGGLQRTCSKKIETTASWGRSFSSPKKWLERFHALSSDDIIYTPSSLDDGPTGLPAALRRRWHTACTQNS